MTGGSRGIGLAIALRAARDGANVALLAKTAEPNPKLPGTIYTAAEEIEAAGGKALPIVGDVRDEDSVADAVAQAAERFGGIDICVNNASAINLNDDRGDRGQALRPDADDQRARHVPRDPSLHPAPQAGHQPAHPHALAAARPRPALVRRAVALHALQVRHEPAHARRRRGAARGRRGRQRAVAAQRDRDRRGPEPARRRRGDGQVAHAGDHRRRRLRDLHPALARVHGQPLHRRRGARHARRPAGHRPRAATARGEGGGELLPDFFVDPGPLEQR